MSTPTETCEQCGSTIIEPGSIAASTGVAFRPTRGGYALTERLGAVACLDCGHVALRLAPLDLRGLRDAHDAGTLKPRMFD